MAPVVEAPKNTDHGIHILSSFQEPIKETYFDAVTPQEMFFRMDYINRKAHNKISPSGKKSYHESKQKLEAPKDTLKGKRTLLKDSDHLEFELPYGWKKLAHRRKSGKSEGNWDTYLISPLGKRLRSNVELERYLEANPKLKCDRSVTTISRHIQSPAKGKPSNFIQPAKPRARTHPIRPRKAPLKMRQKKPQTTKLNEAIEEERGGLWCDFSIAGNHCGLPFANEYELLAHRLSHIKSGRFFQCAKCYLKFSEIRDLSQHVSTNECLDKNMNSMIFCSQCTHRSKDANEAIVHFSTFHAVPLPPVFQCPFCSKEFKLQFALKKHSDKCQLKTFQCQYRLPKSEQNCGKEFPIRSLMVQHYKDHKDHLPCGCQECQETIKDPKGFTCDYAHFIACGHQSPCFNSLRMHKTKMGH